MNVTLRGRVRQTLENMVTDGYANTKSEAIRLAILTFGEKHGEEIIVKHKLDEIDRRILQRKRKLLNANEALGVHAKHVRV